jgi:glycosyltransferase involved in cell wall biosynthesis
MSYNRALKIALIGTRGVPANYGGFETCVEEIGSRLADRGHSVTVYCRESYYKNKIPTYKGMKLIYLPNIEKKAFDTLSHTFLSMLHATFRWYDVYMVFNAANSPTVLIPRLFGKKVAINTDGLEWKRGKWGTVAKNYYLFSEWLSAKLANRIVADSPGIEKYYRERYGTESSVIAYGAEVTESRNADLLRSYGLKPQEYFLQITRFEPENNPLLTMQAFKRLKTDKKLVLVGGVRYESDYFKQMERERTSDIIMPGYIYDKDILNELWCNCYAYIHGNEVGGTNPALLQTMAAGCFTIAIDVPFSHDVLQDCGLFFEKTPESLAGKMKWALVHADTFGSYKEKSRERIRQYYSWDLVTGQYEELFMELSGKKSLKLAKVDRNDLSRLL